MGITNGTLLGPYEITSLIGVGGMGEVYRARDTRLGRNVAIKILSSALSSRPELRDRFEREAHAISNLNHPHICTLHDVGCQDGMDFLVMEYLEGETLAARLGRGALPIQEALKVAIEIGDALAKAHRQGIVHRDLKPANVMLTKNCAKLLDFGLVKLRQGETSQPMTASATAMPTDAAQLTAAGAVLGTLQYMSPEQLEGKEADSRSDIFAFGTMLYEMVTGKKAFTGKTQVSLMAAILEYEPPPMATLQPILPKALDDLVADCLVKNQDDRSESIREVVRQLKRIASPDSPGVASVAKPVSTRPSMTWMAVTVAMILATVFLSMVYFRSGPAAEKSVIRFEVFPPEGQIFPGANNIPRFAVSPDGAYLAYTIGSPGQLYGQVWIRRLDSLEAKAIAGTEGAEQPFWSPDSRTIAFFAEGKLKKVDISGGAVLTLCSLPGNNFGGAWNEEGVILLGTSLTKGLQRVSSSGGVPVQVTTTEGDEATHLWPRFLPDGKHFLYQAGSSLETRTIFVASLVSKDRKALVKSAEMADLAAPDYLLFIRDGALLTQRLNFKTMDLEGEPTVVADAVGSAANGRAGFSVSRNGVLAYRPGEPESATSQLTWVDRTGKPVGLVGSPGVYRGVDLSPDGRYLTTHLEETGETGDIFVMDALSERSRIQRLTFDPSQHNASPVWSPDGKHIYFIKAARTPQAVFLKDFTGVGPEEKVVDVEGRMAPISVSPDGKWLILGRGAPNPAMWILPLTGDRKPVRYGTESVQSSGQISPDGRWIAYTVGLPGAFQVRVQSFPEPGTLFQVATGGSIRPRWRRDGTELFYVGAGAMMAVQVEPKGETLQFGTPQRLFEVSSNAITHATPVLAYAVSNNGQQFLVPRPPNASNIDPATQPLTVVLNWDAPLQKR